MQAIIISGGKGFRLKPISDSIPKSLVPIQDKTLLDYIIHHVKKNGCNNVIICTGHMGDKIKEHVEKKDYGFFVKISQEVTPLGTAGALHLISDYLNDEFFVLYGDVYTKINLRKMLSFHKRTKAELTIALHVSDHPHDSTVVTIDKDYKVKSLVEKPGSNWVKFGNLTTTPLYILRKNILKHIPKSQNIDFAKDVFPNILNKSKIYGYLTNEFARDIGTPERYQSLLKKLKK